MSGAQGSYTFASEPKSVSTRKPKYRDPKETVGAETQKLHQSIHFDRRVHRGNTFSTHSRGHVHVSQAQRTFLAPRRKPLKKEPSPFDIELPRPERPAVDLLPHLVEEVKIVEEDTVEAQTDEFLPEPPPEEYLPQKTGIDAFTQVEDGELFHFDEEVEPLLDVLVNKTLEQALMEVEEEHEIAAMQSFKAEWKARTALQMSEWQDQVKEEQRRWKQKEQVVRQCREKKKREKDVLLKLQALSAAEVFDGHLVPNAVSDLLGVCFPDAKELAIDQHFLPSLFMQVRQQQENARKAAELLDEMVDSRIESSISAQSSAAQAQKEKWDEMCRQKAEEEQICQGIIRIYVDDGAGGRVAIGPIQISLEEVIEEVNKQVFEWLNANEGVLAQQMPHGIQLCLNGIVIQQTEEILTAKAGQISMYPVEAPPETESPDGDELPIEGEIDGSDDQ